MACYETTILLVSLHANGVSGGQTSHQQYQCLYRVRPWFATKEACIDCSKLSLTGSRAGVDSAMDLFETSSLDDLTFSECTGLHFSSTIRRFKRLQTILIEKSIVIDWNENATLTINDFPTLKTIKVISTNFSCFPVGLVDHPLSPSIEWLRFENINASSMLNYVTQTQHWRDVLYFDCNYCALTAFPVVIESMKSLLMVSLIGNDIPYIPEWSGLRNLRIALLWFDMNPRLAELPEAMWSQAATCSSFFLQQTNVSFIPEWISSVANSEFKVFAAGSPLCLQSELLVPYQVTRVSFRVRLSNMGFYIASEQEALKSKNLLWYF